MRVERNDYSRDIMHDTDPTSLAPSGEDIDTDRGGHSSPPSEREPVLTDRARDGLLLRLVATVEAWLQRDREAEDRLRRIDANLTILAETRRGDVERLTRLEQAIADLPCRRPGATPCSGCEAAE